MTDIKRLLEEYIAALPLNKSISIPEAERRAGLFLTAQAQLAEIKHGFTEELIKLTSVQSAVYAQELAKGGAKTMTENKVTAEASPEYTKAREALESIQNDIAYIRAHQELFSNAHVLYRQLSKGEFNG